MISTLVTTAISGGGSNYISYLIQALQEIDKKNRYFILVNKEFDRTIEIKNKNFKKVLIDLPHHPRIIMRPLFFLWQNILAGSLFRKYNINVFHLPNAVPLLNNFDVPHVVTIHDAAEFHNLRHTGLHGRFRIFANQTSEKQATAILTVSEFSKSELIRYLNVIPTKIHVTHLGNTLNLNQKVDAITMNKPFFLHVGGTQSNKNTNRIIEAFQLSTCSQSMNLYFIGETTHLNKSKSEIKNLEKQGIYFVGYVSEEELISYYKGAVGLIYPSLYEGFGLPVLEAMSLGVPVITSDRSSMPEVGGDAVAYVDPESVESIRSAMERMLSDEQYRQELIKKGYERVKQFSWEETARKTIEVYEAAGGKGQHRQ